MKLIATMSKLLANKVVLNVVFVIALIQVLGNLLVGKLNHVVYFILVSGLVSFFTKNMIVVLGVPVIFVSLFASSIVEGLEGMKDDGKKDKEHDKKEDKKKDDVIVKNTKDDDKKVKSVADKDDEKKSGDEPVPEKSGFEVGRGKKKYDIDYASTVEDAYDDLNKILGGDGIKRLTADTQGLMKQQMDLTKAMEGLEPMFSKFEPLLDKAKDMLKNIGGSEGFNPDMMKKLEGLGVKM